MVVSGCFGGDVRVVFIRLPLGWSEGLFGCAFDLFGCAFDL